MPFQPVPWSMPRQAMTWPPLKWSALETHCCRMVQARPARPARPLGARGVGQFSPEDLDGSMEFLWNFYGISMEYLQYGMSMKYLRNVYWIWKIYRIWLELEISSPPLKAWYRKDMAGLGGSNGIFLLSLPFGPSNAVENRWAMFKAPFGEWSVGGFVTYPWHIGDYRNPIWKSLQNKYYPERYYNHSHYHYD